MCPPFCTQFVTDLWIDFLFFRLIYPHFSKIPSKNHELFKFIHN